MPLQEDPRLFTPQCDLSPVETVHRNPWFEVRNRGGYFTTEYKYPNVIVLPVVDRHSIVMVRVKRPILNDDTLELPAGSCLDSDQTPREAVAMELAEETGIKITDLRRFKRQSPIAGSPNRNPVLLHIFEIDLAMAEYEQRKDHDDEVTGVELLSFAEVSSLLMQGTIYVAVPIAVLGRYLLANGYKP